jgi:hypothetical protein
VRSRKPAKTRFLWLAKSVGKNLMVKAGHQNVTGAVTDVVTVVIAVVKTQPLAALTAFTVLLLHH